MSQEGGVEQERICYNEGGGKGRGWQDMQEEDDRERQEGEEATSHRPSRREGNARTVSMNHRQYYIKLAAGGSFT